MDPLELFFPLLGRFFIHFSSLPSPAVSSSYRLKEAARKLPMPPPHQTFFCVSSAAATGPRCSPTSSSSAHSGGCRSSSTAARFRRPLPPTQQVPVPPPVLPTHVPWGHSPPRQAVNNNNLLWKDEALSYKSP